MQGPGRYTLAKTEAAINKELLAGENVIIDTANLSLEHVAEIENLVQSNGWGGHVLFSNGAP